MSNYEQRKENFKEYLKHLKEFAGETLNDLQAFERTDDHLQSFIQESLSGLSESNADFMRTDWEDYIVEPNQLEVGEDEDKVESSSEGYSSVDERSKVQIQLDNLMQYISVVHESKKLFWENTNLCTKYFMDVEFTKVRAALDSIKL